MYHQQTVLFAIDLERKEIMPATQLLELSEADFTALRRASLAARNSRRRHGLEVGRFKCAACERWLYLSRRLSELGNRWFAHDHANPECPWSEGSRLSPDTHRAMIYRGFQEGEAHRRLKEFIAQWLAKDPQASKVNTEQVTFSDVVAGEWKRPDVRCDRGSRKLVFELQLNYTFLTEVLKREEFYRRDGIFILWIFRSFDLRKSTVVDQAFHDLRNVLVLDDAAIARTIETGNLTFTGYFHRPNVFAGELNDVWDKRFVTLDDLQYPDATYRAYFFDRDKALEDAKRDAAAWKQSQLEQEWRQGWNEFLSAAVDYYDSDYDEGKREDLIDVLNYVSGLPLGWRGLDEIESPEFLDTHGILSVLLSLKRDRAVGFRCKTAYRVLEAGLRQHVRGQDNFGYAVLYIRAYKVWRPASVTETQRRWVVDQAYRIKKSLERGEFTYARHTRFDEVICTLFPELEDALSDSFGIQPPPTSADGAIGSLRT